MDYKSIILKFAFNNGKLNKSFTCKLLKNKNKYDNIINYIMFYYDNKSKSLREALYRLYYNIDIIPKCPVCGKDLNFIGKSNKIYLSHCSNKCKKLDKNVQEKFINTCLNKYENITNRKKAKETCLNKYGVENPFQIESIKNKIQKNNKRLFDLGITQEKMKETCIKKYNVNWYTQSQDFINKSIVTSLKKYNTEYPIQSQEVKCKYNWDIINKKIYETKKKNKSFNISEPEDISYNILKEKYNDIICQYKSDLYPFNCDFYVPSKDLYIECNYHWTHGGKPYEATKEDILKLEYWKSKNTDYYNEAIKTWTIRDVYKRKVAKENNLNYIEIWNLNEIGKL